MITTIYFERDNVTTEIFFDAMFKAEIEKISKEKGIEEDEVLDIIDRTLGILEMVTPIEVERIDK